MSCKNPSSRRLKAFNARLQKELADVLEGRVKFNLATGEVTREAVKEAPAQHIEDTKPYRKPGFFDARGRHRYL